MPCMAEFNPMFCHSLGASQLDASRFIGWTTPRIPIFDLYPGDKIGEHIRDVQHFNELFRRICWIETHTQSQNILLTILPNYKRTHFKLKTLTPKKYPRRLTFCAGVLVPPARMALFKGGLITNPSDWHFRCRDVGFSKLPAKQLTVDNRLSPPTGVPHPIWLWINTYTAYTYHFQGDEHPFTSYFDVHQGDRVLTHPHITTMVSWYHRFPAPWCSQISHFGQGKNKDGKTQGEKPQSRHMVSWPKNFEDSNVWKLLQSLEIWNRKKTCLLTFIHLCDFSRCFKMILSSKTCCISWFGWILDGFSGVFTALHSWKQTGSNPFGPQFLRRFRRVGCRAVPSTHPSLHGSWDAMGILGTYGMMMDDGWFLRFGWEENVVFFFRITSGIVIMIMNFMTSFTSFYFLTIPLETLPQMGSRMWVDVV